MRFVFLSLRIPVLVFPALLACFSFACSEPSKNLHRSDAIFVDAYLGDATGISGGISNDCTAAEVPAPTSARELFAWLQTRSYACWARESRVHPSAGPHGGNVRTYLNSQLESELREGRPRSIGAISVKELYSNGTTNVTGWAVMVKTQSGTASDSWYWYEIFSTTSPDARSYEGHGLPLCVNCHRAVQNDHTLVPFPLQ